MFKPNLTIRVNILETQTKSVENCYSAQKSLEESVNKIKKQHNYMYPNRNFDKTTKRI